MRCIADFPIENSTRERKAERSRSRMEMIALRPAGGKPLRNADGTGRQRTKQFGYRRR
jgi:hypothetical protein